MLRSILVQVGKLGVLAVEVDLPPCVFVLCSISC